MNSFRPRLLFIQHSFYNRAGVEEHSRTLSEELRGRFEIFIAFPHEGQIVLLDENRQATVYPADPAQWPVTPYHGAVSGNSLSLILSKVDPALIHILHFFNWPLSVIDQAVAFGRPVVMSFHDYFAITPFYTMQGITDPHLAFSKEFSLHIFRADLTDYFVKRAEILGNSFSKVRKLIVPSSYLQETLQQIYPLPFEIIEYGIKPFTPLPARQKSGGLRFGCVGSLLPQKGWLSVVQAFPEVAQRHPETELLFFGGGQDPSEFKRPGVSFFGAYEQEDLPKMCAQFDIGIIPSVFAETYCMVLSELWMAKKPAAAANIGAMGRRISDGLNGKLFPPGNSAAIAETMRWFIENPAWRQWELPAPYLAADMAEQYSRVYQSLIMN